ncbi:AraC family transcriptional regulator [Opitutales bacterium]|nr:AraC family transcriptional regulator [Opitutales bacterium]
MVRTNFNVSTKSILHVTEWFESNQCNPLLLSELFEDLPGVSFFIKDKEHRLVMVNDGFLPRLGLSQEELFGKTDFDLFPARLAEHFRRDDRDIFETKKAKLNILELVFNSQGLPDWYLTNKYPLFNDRGDVAGLMGTVRPYGDGEKKELKWERDDEIGRAVNHIRNHFRSEMAISDLVKVSGLSHRKLHRGFVELFGVAPMQFITRTRIEAACDDLLSSTKKLSVIAKENGFYDQSSFTQLFRRQMKITPLKYRKQRGFI